MGSGEITWLELALFVTLLALPALTLRALQIPYRDLLIGAGRMIAQLFLVGLYLAFVFALNNPWLNLGWIAVMLLVASATVISRSRLNWRIMLWPSALSMALVLAPVLLLFIQLLVQPNHWYQAQYLIPVAGMLLGNGLNSVVIALEQLSTDLKERPEPYLVLISMGATRREALLPMWRRAIGRAVSPAVATLSTLGLVALPGMMTGQILAGTSPSLAIRYQIAIMIGIVTCQIMMVVVTLLLSSRWIFDDWALPRGDLLRD